MRRIALVACSLLLSAGFASASECPGHPDALGVSRTIVVDPTEHTRVGTMQYAETLPLADKEVVLTFDDGPLPRYSDRILDILASECVKATYFIVGRMARAYPDGVRRMYAAGHTIATHSQNHPFTFHKMPLGKAEQEIEDGIASTAAALGEGHPVAPFFRIPGLLRAEGVENYLAQRKIMTWSADFPADDWKRGITDKDIVRLALERLEAKGKGILLLHDIHPATALALPVLLRELKQRGYRIVHVVPASPDRPKTATVASDWIMNPASQAHRRAGLKRRHVMLPAPGLEGFEGAIAPIVLSGRDARPGAIASLPGHHPDPAANLPAPDWASFDQVGMPMANTPLRTSVDPNAIFEQRRIRAASTAPAPRYR
ncbi:MAG: polysaccharide deacetylase family protein [Pseudorhodoplanes sp.]